MVFSYQLSALKVQHLLNCSEKYTKLFQTKNRAETKSWLALKWGQLTNLKFSATIPTLLQRKQAKLQLKTNFQNISASYLECRTTRDIITSQRPRIVERNVSKHLVRNRAINLSIVNCRLTPVRCLFAPIAPTAVCNLERIEFFQFVVACQRCQRTSSPLLEVSIKIFCLLKFGFCADGFTM